MKSYIKPFHVVPVPIDKDGNGPATPGPDVITYYEIWDAANVTMAISEDEDLAKLLTSFLNARELEQVNQC